MGDEKEWGKFRVALYSLMNRDPDSNRMVVELARVSSADQTLDVGCGPGAAVRHAARIAARSVGVDRSEAMVDTARRRSAGLENVQFEVASAEELPFPDGAFTAVWTVHAFHHWADRGAGLAEAGRVLAPGGRLLIVERKTKRGHGLSPQAAEGLRRELEVSGLGEVSVTRRKKELVITAVKSPEGEQPE